MLSRTSVTTNILVSIVVILGTAFVISEVVAAFGAEIGLPEAFTWSLISVIAILAGVSYTKIVYPFLTFSFLSEKKELGRIVLWGIIGGAGISVIEFPYAILRGEYELPRELIVDPGQGLVTTCAFLTLATVVVPIVEEAFFRGVVYRLIRDSFDPFWGLIVSTTLFTAGHEFFDPFETLRLAVGSSLLTYIYQRTASVGASAIAHSIWSLTWYGTNYAVILF